MTTGRSECHRIKSLACGLAFAEQGLPEAGSIGYEIFDRDQTLGDFQLHSEHQSRARHSKANWRGPSQRFHIGKAARVHLVMPRRELFSRQRLDPSASIVLKMRGIGAIRPGQSDTRGAAPRRDSGGRPQARPHFHRRRSRHATVARRPDDGDDKNLAALNAEERRISFETQIEQNTGTAS